MRICVRKWKTDFVAAILQLGINLPLQCMEIRFKSLNILLMFFFYGLFFYIKSEQFLFSFQYYLKKKVCYFHVFTHSFWKKFQLENGRQAEQCSTLRLLRSTHSIGLAHCLKHTYVDRSDSCAPFLSLLVVVNRIQRSRLCSWIKPTTPDISRSWPTLNRNCGM